MLDWTIEQELERQKERLREVEQMRLVHQALAARGESTGLRYRALVYLGGRLIQTGRRLQARYGEDGGIAVSPPAPVARSPISLLLRPSTSASLAGDSGIRKDAA